MTKIKNMSSEIVIFGILDGHIWDHVLDCLSCLGSLIDRKWQTRHGFCEATFSFWGVELSCLMSFWGSPSRMKIEDMSSKIRHFRFWVVILETFFWLQHDKWAKVL